MSNDPIRPRPSALPLAAPASANDATPVAAPAANAVTPVNTVAAPAPADAFKGAAANGAAAVDPSQVAALMGDKLKGDPALAGKMDVLQQLTARRQELMGEMDSTKGELEAWRKEHGGIDSNLRILAGGAKVVDNLVHGNFKFWEGAGDKVTDAETIEKAPQRAAMGDINVRIAQIDKAIEQLSSGGAIAGGDGVDYRLDELSKMAGGQKLSPEAMLDGRLARLKKDAEVKNGSLGHEHYVATAQAFFELKDDKGEGFLTHADGKPSVTGLLNGLIGSGALQMGGHLITSPADLGDAKKALAQLRGDAKKANDPKIAPLLAQLSDAALDDEGKRLDGLTKAAPFASVMPKMDEAKKAADSLEDSGFSLGGFAAGIGHVLDSPETLLMAGAAKLTAGKVGSFALEKAGMKAASVGELSVMRKAGQLEWGLMGRYALATGIDGVAFQTVLNGMNIARGKADRAGWSPTDYARSILLFEVMGGINANAFARDVAKTKLGQFGRGAQRLGEEAAGLTTLAGAEGLIRTGNLKGTVVALRDNLQFLLAMRLMGGFSALRDPKSLDLNRLQRQAMMSLSAAEKMSAGGADKAKVNDATVKALDAQRAFEIKLLEVTRGFQKSGMTSKGQQKIGADINTVDANRFLLQVEAARRQAFAKASTPQEQAEVNTLFNEYAQSPAFFDAAVGKIFVNADSAKLANGGGDAMVRHEGAHLAFQVLPQEQRNTIVSAITASAEWPALQKAFAGNSPMRRTYSSERTVDEMLAHWNANASGAQEPLAARFAKLIDDTPAASEAIKAHGLDLRALDTKGVSDAMIGKPYNPSVVSNDLSPYLQDDIPRDYPQELRFTGDGKFVQRLNDLNRVTGNSFSYADLHRALFGDNKVSDPVAVARQLMLNDISTSFNTLSQLEVYPNERLFIGNRDNQFYLQRLANLPFVGSSREVRDVQLEGIAIRNARSTAAITKTLNEDKSRSPAEAKAVWDAVLIGAGPHSAAVAMELEKANPNARVLVVDESDVGSQFSRTGAAFVVNSSAYGDEGVKAVPETAEGDLNPTLGPVLVADLQSGKYSQGRDIGDASVINLNTTQADTLFNTRVRADGIEDGFASGVARRENWPARYRIAVKTTNEDGSRNTRLLYTNFPVASTGIPDLGLGRFEKRSQDFLADELRASQTEAGKLNPRVQTGLQVLEGFKTLANPKEFALNKRTLLVGSGDSGLVVAEALYGTPASPDFVGNTFYKRQLGVVGQTLFATGKNGPGNEATPKEVRDAFQLNDALRYRYRDVLGAIRGRPRDLTPVAANVVAVREGNGGKLNAYLNNKAADEVFEQYERTGVRLSAGDRFQSGGKQYELIQTPEKLVAAEEQEVDNVILTSGQTSRPEDLLRAALPGAAISDPLTKAVQDQLRLSSDRREQKSAKLLTENPFVAIRRGPNNELTGYVPFPPPRDPSRAADPNTFNEGPTRLGNKEAYVIDLGLGRGKQFFRAIPISSRISNSPSVQDTIDNGRYAPGAITLLAEESGPVYDPSQPLSEQEIAPAIGGPALNPGQPLNTNYGRRITGSNLFLVGPTVGPNLVPKEALANVKENSASLFNLIDGSGAIGRIIAGEIAANPVANPYQPPTTLPTVLELAANGAPQSRSDLAIGPMTALEQLEARPTVGNELALLKLRVAAELGQFRFRTIPFSNRIDLEVSRTAAADGSGRVRFASSTLDGQSLQRIADGLGKDQRFMAILKQVTSVPGRTLTFDSNVQQADGGGYEINPARFEVSTRSVPPSEFDR